jgi:anthranilate synthase component 1
LSIAIRTAVVRNGRATWSAGGGIVADSDPEAEYRETLDKARAIATAVAETQATEGPHTSAKRESGPRESRGGGAR